MAITIGGGVSIGGGIAFTPTVSADPYWSSVSLLLPGNGSNGSQSITDASSNNVSISVAGDTQISTAQSKWNGSSIYFDGTGTGLTPATSSLFAFGTGDFTVECWAYQTSSGQMAIFATGSGATVNPYFYINGTTPTLFYNNTGVATGPVISLNTWNHLALTRVNTQFRFYTNGVGGNAATLADSLTASGPIGIGRSSAGTQLFSGYMNDVRVTKGVARYTSNFSVPTEAFPIG